ncbi:hypothetical protein N5P37_002562 [Trichoderma harzianum]|nr:hypothetical protein N5P37_002562 [Trichoderma harzianum]
MGMECRIGRGVAGWYLLGPRGGRAANLGFRLSRRRSGVLDLMRRERQQEDKIGAEWKRRRRRRRRSRREKRKQGKPRIGGKLFSRFLSFLVRGAKIKGPMEEPESTGQDTKTPSCRHQLEVALTHEAPLGREYSRIKRSLKIGGTNSSNQKCKGVAIIRAGVTRTPGSGSSTKQSDGEPNPRGNAVSPKEGAYSKGMTGPLEPGDGHNFFCLGGLYCTKPRFCTNVMLPAYWCPLKPHDRAVRPGCS